uniref:Uncharacterized protein n=1 Tax=Compsopogon caeruleus TaxID=31354 RepID=A0A7S1XET1_9RHOD
MDPKRRYVHVRDRKRSLKTGLRGTVSVLSPFRFTSRKGEALVRVCREFCLLSPAGPYLLWFGSVQNAMGSGLGQDLVLFASSTSKWEPTQLRMLYGTRKVTLFQHLPVTVAQLSRPQRLGLKLRFLSSKGQVVQ